MRGVCYLTEQSASILALTHSHWQLVDWPVVWSCLRLYPVQFPLWWFTRTDIRQWIQPTLHSFMATSLVSNNHFSFAIVTPESDLSYLFHTGFNLMNITTITLRGNWESIKFWNWLFRFNSESFVSVSEYREATFYLFFWMGVTFGFSD